MNEKVQLITTTILPNNTLKIELVCESTKENEKQDLNIYFIDKNNEKYKASYTYGDNIKALLNVPVKEGTFNLYVNNNSKVEFVDNKNEKIVNKPNEYKIFTATNIINILEDGIIKIEKRRFGSKLKYEIHKQINSIKTLKRPCLLRLLKGKEKYFLFNDRLLYGDDSAEQLFRYFNQNDKKIAKKCYFVLDKNAKCFNEIKKIGKVLKYGSVKHKIKYLNSKMVISSHASYYDRVYNPFTEREMEFYKDIIHKKFVFLQHGVIMNDVHQFLQRSRIIADLFVTTTNDEEKIVKDNQYLYENGVVACTGLPRFDKLVDKRKKVILISPTWRAYLTNVEYTNDKGNDFEESEYFKKYSSLLQNKELQNYLKQKNYQIKFLLHPAFQNFKEYFENLNNKYVKIILTKDIKYSDLFNECSIFITDYSSIHFDVAFLKKPIIYYQFDKNKFFESHYTKGYYDYEKDGFGEVIEQEKQIIEKIKYYIDNNCQIEEKYKKQIENTFRYLNRKNSERVYKQILKLDNKKDKIYRFNNVS